MILLFPKKNKKQSPVIIITGDGMVSY